MALVALSRYYMAATLLTEPVLDVIRRELRRISPDVRIDSEDISKVLASEVIKRDCLVGEKADEARKGVRKAAGKALRATKEKEQVPPPDASQLDSGAVPEAASPDDGASS